MLCIVKLNVLIQSVFVFCSRNHQQTLCVVVYFTPTQTQTHTFLAHNKHANHKGYKYVYGYKKKEEQIVCRRNKTALTNCDQLHNKVCKLYLRKQGIRYLALNITKKKNLSVLFQFI